MCDVADIDSNTDSNTNLEEDGLHQVNPASGNFSCITQNCKNCGTDIVKMKILEENDGIEKCKEKITWNRWKWVLKNLKTKVRKLDIEKNTGTRMELVQQYLDDLKAMSFHLFSCNWNYSQFTYLKDNLKPGQLLQVLDFSQNYMNIYQDEPQSVHWDHSMTVIRPIVNYFKMEDGKRITEEHIMLSDDLLHDKFAVRVFEKTTMDHLRAKGIVLKQIIQFCDNCAVQYKSKGPFQFISESNIPTVWLFFGAHHGKGPADRVVGRTKAAARRAVKREKLF